MDFNNDGGHAVLLMKAGGLPSFTDTEFTFRSQEQIKGEQVLRLTAIGDNVFCSVHMVSTCMQGCCFPTYWLTLKGSDRKLAARQIKSSSVCLLALVEAADPAPPHVNPAAVPGQAAEPGAGNLLHRRLQHGLLRPRTLQLQAAGELLATTR